MSPQAYGKNFMAIDQYGQTEHALGPRPRKELLDRCNRKSAQRQYTDMKAGTFHTGWVVGGRRFTVYEVTPMRGKP